jgi:glutamate dehydrogenase
MGIDDQSDVFTVCGLGDMGGDVFGNGMLQSRKIRLVAAFNHVHIFLDPDPDPERSYIERERLFRLPRSTWRDYDAGLISKGGGVFDRSAKAIPLSPEIRELFRLTGDSCSGEEMIRHLLTGPVDLLYNGGIGTYVKSASETDAEVGDRANDRVRVNAEDVRAKVVAEGGNLGFTQLGRLEYADRGGLINTDAIDNSGGVDMSDHEVNIKILLDMLVKKGELRGKEERNDLFMEMTEDVAALVLADNANQARAITLDEARSIGRYEEFLDLVEDMVGAGIIDRNDEYIPRRQDLLASPRRSSGLPRPLLSVLLGYTKMWAYQMVMRTDLPDSGSARPFLGGYFPRVLRDRFAEHFSEHPLRREIVATGAVNHVINCGGITLVSRFMTATMEGIGKVIAAYLDVERDSGAGELRSRIISKGLEARVEQKALIDIEAALEPIIIDVLQGRTPSASAGAFENIRARLGL